MTRPEIEEKVATFLHEELEMPADRLRPDARLKEDLGIDSLDVVDIVVLVNDTFGFKLKTADVLNLTTLGSFCDLIKQRLGTQD